MRRPAFALLFVLAFVALLVPASHQHTAEATPHGTNGVIAFERYASSEFHIWTMNPDGGDRQQFTDGNSDDYSPDWNVAGSEIVYRADHFSGGGGLRRGTFNSTNDDGIANTLDAFSPHWSPDGTKIAFEASLGNSTEISVINRNGTGRMDLTDTPDIHEYAPAWSPDGSRIAYVAGKNLVSDIWIMNADGTNPMQITNAPDQDYANLDFSPDGQSLAYATSSDGGSTYGIARINLDNTGYMELTQGPRDIIPTWSPDGTMIAFERYLPAAHPNSAPAGGPGDKYHIFVMNADGSDQTDISPTNETSDFSPDWQSIPAPFALIQGDVDCSGGVDSTDALFWLADNAGILFPDVECPAINGHLQTQSFGELIWGNLDCSEGIDTNDVILLLRDAAGLPPASIQNCPALRIAVALVDS